MLQRRLLTLLVPLLFLWIGFGQQSAKAQAVNIFIHQWPSTSWGFPDPVLVNNAYSTYFSPVNITTGLVPSAGSLAGYDVLVICELTFSSSSSVVSNAQRGVIEAFVANGGHVVWVSENSPGQAAPGSDQSMLAIQNLWGINLARVPTNYSFCVPYQPASGPGGLTNGVTSVGTTTSYDYFSGPATLHQNVVLSSSTGVNTCSQPGIAGMAFLFPEPYICTLGGTITLYGEVQMWSTLMNSGQYLTHAQNVARMHHAIITANLPAIDALNQAFVPNVNCSAPTPCTILSVEMSSFQAFLQEGNTAHLAWWTESEIMNKGFEVEQALPGSGDFQKIGWVAGAGNSDVQQMYQFFAEDLIAGTHQFRLRILDEAGGSEYSEVRTLQVESGRQFQVYPTLVDAQTQELNLYWPNDKAVNARLYDAQGKLVGNLHQGPVPSEGIVLSLRELSLGTGAYLLRVQDGEQQGVERLLVER